MASKSFQQNNGMNPSTQIPQGETMQLILKAKDFQGGNAGFGTGVKQFTVSTGTVTCPNSRSKQKVVRRVEVSNVHPGSAADK